MLLCTFVDCLNMGGNLLLDIGPKEDGTIPQEEIDVLKAFGRWTSKHKDAIYQTRAGIPAGYFNGYTALNKVGDVLYLYMPYKPIGKVSLKGIVNKVEKIEVVGNNTPLNFEVYNKLSWSEVPESSISTCRRTCSIPTSPCWRCTGRSRQTLCRCGTSSDI